MEKITKEEAHKLADNHKANKQLKMVYSNIRGLANSGVYEYNTSLELTKHTNDVLISDGFSIEKNRSIFTIKW